MWEIRGRRREARSRVSAAKKSPTAEESSSDVRVNWAARIPRCRKRKTYDEKVFRFIVGSPEGIRTLDLMAENHVDLPEKAISSIRHLI